MSKPITKTQMVGFRGATSAFELDLDPGKDLTMLFGENGSGKSTILDAMDVVCRGTNGCLDGISVGQNPGKYLCALGSQPATLKVTIHSNSESWTGTMRRSAISVAGPAVKPNVKILRRNAILKLVLAQPNERYKELRQFIDIGVIERSESTLQQKLNDVGQGIDQLIDLKGNLSNQLDNLWGAEKRPGPGQTAMAWAENKVDTGITGLNTQLERLTAVVEAINGATAANSDYATRASNHSTLKQQIEDVDQEIAAAPSVNAPTAVMLLESLEKSKAYIEAEETLDNCPTCKRPIGRDELLATVTQEFTQLSELKTLSDKNRASRRSWTSRHHIWKKPKQLWSMLSKRPIPQWLWMIFQKSWD